MSEEPKADRPGRQPPEPLCRWCGGVGHVLVSRGGTEFSRPPCRCTDPDPDEGPIYGMEE